MKVALVHDWLTGMRGGEKCLEVFCEMFPKADLYTLLHVPGTVSATIEKMSIHTSPLQKLPFAAQKYRYYLPLFPWIVNHWRPKRGRYDLVLSSCHCVAKGLRFAQPPRSVCYCYTPMRYIWCQTKNYYAGDWRQPALNLAAPRLRAWDLRSNEQVDEFIGISRHVSERIRRFYGRVAATIYPPVDDQFYHLPESSAEREDFHLIVGALEPYKRIDLAVEAFRQWQRPLKIVGKGTMLESLRSQAPSNIEFLGWQSNETIRSLYQRARALVFPGEEDFGIVPVEAQACGCPVVAYGVGGACETIEENKTGVFFRDPTVDSLLEALKRCDTISWDPRSLRSQAEKFSRRRFRQAMEAYLSRPR
ncbi:MAG: glycosyltransferase [Verrucomicrobiae bacterium]|nr:glycosyltransferase [Verrucomicrobiae bacterium]